MPLTLKLSDGSSHDLTIPVKNLTETAPTTAASSARP
ncbi:hypothetical protein HDA39_007893 [Kribbella italica]|uniref:Uncharacterized protein n=1 Tax=Kribbella italica TaxID=1540520 RepID=A0A7W9JFG2_9ACTN|nr:hypothetical protein [Kribbella italica]